MNNLFIKIISLFLIWRVALFLVAFVATLILQFGGRFPYANVVLTVTGFPSWIWGFGNFDGVHYLRIAQNGYTAEYSQAFFPLYPLIVSIFTDLNLFPKNQSLDTRIFVDPIYFMVAFLLSNFFFILALFIFYKLIRLDFNDKIALSTLLLLVAFPTSFYFGSIYTESLFMTLMIGSIYFIRKNNFIMGGILAALSSATRIFGLFLIPVFLIELYYKLKSKEIEFNSPTFTKGVIGSLLTPFGILFYMLYLKFNFDNPLYFLSSQPFFGAEREDGGLILLPQVIFRYLKIFFQVPINSLSFFNAALEFFMALIPLMILILFFKKMRRSYWIFTLGCFILPTLTGTLSSMPRYALMGLLILPYLPPILGKYYNFVLLFWVSLQIILLSLFVRGYWIA